MPNPPALLAEKRKFTARCHASVGSTSTTSSVGVLHSTVNSVAEDISFVKTLSTELPSTASILQTPVASSCVPSAQTPVSSTDTPRKKLLKNRIRRLQSLRWKMKRKVHVITSALAQKISKPKNALTLSVTLLLQQSLLCQNCSCHSFAVS